ncbi:MAG: DUF4230 domain-containing protein [Muribaculaceae bacterium]|nr:DUF4230 domain-containing protein [Muribaculaceae bacterium]
MRIGKVRIYFYGVVALLIIVLVAVVWVYFALSGKDEDKVKLYEAKIADVKSCVELVSVDFYADVIINDTIGTKHLVARQLQTGSVSFDVEKLQTEERGDTLIVILPKERVIVRESTDKDAYQVIDTWNDQLFGSNNLTASEENIIKERVRAEGERRLRERGTIERARREAAENLRTLLEQTQKRPVEVIVGGNPYLIRD